MAQKNVIVLMGQSNPEGQANILDLPAALRGPQLNTRIFNFENNAIEILNVDGVGPNLPNNTTFHTAGVHGPEMSLGAAAVAELGEITFFKFCVPSASLGPHAVLPVWNPESLDLYVQLAITRWPAYVAAEAALGNTINVIGVVWYQGETDSITEGNDLAYYGMFTRFKNQVRLLLQPYSTSLKIRWVTVLIHNALVPSGLGYLTTTAGNVRAAQLKSGWDDDEYRIVDSDRVSFQTDLFHVDSPGQVALGNLIWEAINMTTSNTMALEQYDLLSLRTRLGEEFGINLDQTTPDGIANAIIVNKRINDAVSWIVNRRKNWPWLERKISLDVGERSTSVSDLRYGSAVFFKAQKQALLASFNPSATQPREIVDFEGSGFQGLVVASVAGTTIETKQSFTGDPQVCAITAITVGNPTIITVNLATSAGGTAVIPVATPTFGVVITSTSHLTPNGTFNGNWNATRLSDNSFSIPYNSIGATAVTFGNAQIAKQFRIAQEYFELPEDYIRNSTLHTDEDVEENTIDYVTPASFEREVRANRVSTTLDRIYTVLPDPLNISSKKYLASYPFFLTRNILHVAYFGDAKKMLADLDEPDVPRSDRFVIWYAAAWFVAQWQKADSVAFYRDGALNELERMTKEYQLSDDTTESIPRGSSDNDYGPIRGPGGFPEFELP